MTGDNSDDLTEDGFLGGKLRLRQPRRGHRSGHDAILLAAATGAIKGQKIVEFGSGVGAAGLALARRVAGIDLVLVEVDPGLAALSQQNADLNGLSAKVCILDIGADAAAFTQAGLPAESADGVLMNPPFNHGSRHQPSADAERSLAHMASADTLNVWIHAARRVLKSNGVLTMIWRADGLAEVLAALARGFGGIAVLPVHPKPAIPAIRILVRAVKGARGETTIWPALTLNTSDGQMSEVTAALLNGQDILPLAHAGLNMP